MPALFKNHHPFTVLVLLIFAILGNLQLMLHPAVPAVLPDQVAYGWLVGVLRILFGQHASAYALFAVFLQFGQALYLNHITVRYRLFGKATYLPAFVYLLLLALHPGIGGFSPQLFANWALIAALQAGFALNNAPSPRKQIFNLGFLLSLTALLSPAALLLVGCLMAALGIMRSFKPGEWVVAFLGYLTPIYFFAGILFVTDRLEVLQHMNYFMLDLQSSRQHLLHTVGVLSGLALALLFSLFSLQQAFGRTAISVRRTWWLVLSCFVISLPAALLAQPQPHHAQWLLLAPSLSLLLALPLHGEHSRKLGNLLFWFLIVLLIFAQFSLLY